MLISYPSADVLDQLASATPAHMRPNTQPSAICAPGLLTDSQCDKIIDAGNKIETYKYPGCNAITREFDLPIDSSIEPVIEFAKLVNSIYFGFKLDKDPSAWLQTYFAGGNYQIHTDGVWGETRKLTAVLMLTDGDEYDGGDLRLHVHPECFLVSRKRGSIIIFPPWLLHEVTTVVKGFRQSLNVGFFGPPFK